jgi:hypothetical protein
VRAPFFIQLTLRLVWLFEVCEGCAFVIWHEVSHIWTSHALSALVSLPGAYGSCVCGSFEVRSPRPHWCAPQPSLASLIPHVCFATPDPPTRPSHTGSDPI